MNHNALFNLTGRTAVITGVLGNLGPVWARALLEAGANVLGLDRPEAKPEKTFVSLEKKYGKKLTLTKSDILLREDLLKAREICRKTYGTTSILVNNAGIDAPPGQAGQSQKFAEIPIDEVRRVMDVNFIGAFQVLQVFGDDLASSGRGSVINIGSLYSVVSPDQRLYDHIPMDPPFLKPPAYGASKAALVNITKFMATLWGSRGVRVNALSPGGVSGKQDDEFRKKFNTRVPLGRMATFEDLPGPLLFLASDASSYVTGINLIVDGGFTSW